MKEITIYSDGACKGNPGYGGWACLLEYGNTVKPLQGMCEVKATSNQMELHAILEGIEALKSPCAITLYTDSSNCIGWLSGKFRIKNQEIGYLVKEINHAVEKGQHKVTYVKVRGHAGNANNERVDSMASKQAELAKEKFAV